MKNQKPKKTKKNPFFLNHQKKDLKKIESRAQYVPSTGTRGSIYFLLHISPCIKICGILNIYYHDINMSNLIEIQE